MVKKNGFAKSVLTTIYQQARGVRVCVGGIMFTDNNMYFITITSVALKHRQKKRKGDVGVVVEFTQITTGDEGTPARQRCSV